jgi:hypothetical protein
MHLTPLATCAQLVEADPGDHRGQPGAHVLDRGRVGATHPQPGVLEGVVGIGGRAEHSVRDRAQLRAVLLEHVLGDHGLSVLLVSHV